MRLTLATPSHNMELFTNYHMHPEKSSAFPDVYENISVMSIDVAFGAETDVICAASQPSANLLSRPPAKAGDYSPPLFLIF